MNDARGELRKIFITVKTYPTLSKRYDELVCTAGILEDGSWVRVYPIPFRKLDYEDRYKKYQWMEVPIIRNTKDPRPDSYKITDYTKLKMLGEAIGTKDSWRARKEILFKKNKPYDDLAHLITLAKKNELSLAIFKPTKVLAVVAKKVDDQWSKEQLDTLKDKASQLSLLQTEEEVRKQFQVVKKLPYKFSYRLQDINGKESTMMIEDWEIGMLYWKCLHRADGNEQKAIELVKQKYFDEFTTKDLHLFLGTTRRHHFTGPNPFVIIGVFPPPIVTQQSLF